jgi:hypothetical protein
MGVEVCGGGGGRSLFRIEADEVEAVARELEADKIGGAIVVE